MKKLLATAWCLVLLTLCDIVGAQADLLWLQPDGAAMKVLAGELHAPTALSALRDAKALLPGGKTAHTVTAPDQYRFTATKGDSRFTALRVGDDGVLTYFQARYGLQETTALNDLELVPTKPGATTFQLFFKGQPANAVQVLVDTAAGWRKSLKPDKNGLITLDTPIPGLYVLQISARLNNGSVLIDDKKYEDIRYTATLSFEVDQR